MNDIFPDGFEPVEIKKEALPEVSEEEAALMREIWLGKSHEDQKQLSLGLNIDLPDIRGSVKPTKLKVGEEMRLDFGGDFEWGYRAPKPSRSDLAQAKQNEKSREALYEAEVAQATLGYYEAKALHEKKKRVEDATIGPEEWREQHPGEDPFAGDRLA